jgi:hypothetical protein
MRKTYLGVMVAAAGLLGACAGKDVRDEGLLRIEESMRPETHPAPEGIELGLDAPPLAPPDRDVLWAPVASFPEHMREVGTPSPHFYSGPFAFPLLMPTPYCPHAHLTPRYHVEQRPGGTTPGLLP